jgi:two-component system, OmpR family, sensor histidine kinase BaeS
MDKSRFDRLHVKLFAAIAGTIALLTLAAYLVFSWSFDRGFIDYVSRADAARLEPMTATLAESYAREGNWEWIAKDRDRWVELSRTTLGLPPSGAVPEATPRGRFPLTIDPRLLLFDADRRLLIGRAEAAPRAVLKPIVVQEQAVGYLGYVPRLELLASLESVYLSRQHITFAALALGMLLASLALGAGLSYWLTGRIRSLAGGTQALIQGRYDERLAPRGRDELSQLASDFNTLAETLGAARNARQQWIADISHELRTPLAVLRAEIESLQDGVRALDQASVASLAGEVTHLSRLVEDLHTLSLSDLGALTYFKEPVAVAETVEEVVDAQRRSIEQRGLAIDLQLDSEARVLADDTRLAQVFGNLLQNSVRYTDSPGRIAIIVRRAGSRVIVDWQDSSPGVPAAELPRLMERLYRVESSRSRAGGGSGLGLAIAKAIVEGHGGTMTAGASPLGGLRMEIALPAYGGNGHG